MCQCHCLPRVPIPHGSLSCYNEVVNEVDSLRELQAKPYVEA